jgi:hypothetical protein
MGRPTKLTPKRANQLLWFIRHGRPLDTACALVGINRDTCYGWVRRGRAASDRRACGLPVEAAEDPYREFAEALAEARAAAESDAIDVILQATERDWRAAAWFLEHSFPDRWGRQSRGTLDVVHHMPAALDEQLRRGAAVRAEAERRLALPARDETANDDDDNKEHNRDVD